MKQDKSYIKPIEKFTEIVNESLSMDTENYSVKFLYGSLKSLLVSSMINIQKKSILIICRDRKDADDYFHDLSGLANPDNIAYLLNPHRSSGAITSDDDLSYWLIEGLLTILKTEQPVIITTEEILKYKVPAPEVVSKEIININLNQEIGFDEFTTKLMLNGFDRKDFVAQQGDIAIRGGIVDFFPINKENPVRIEFFGDTVETIRTFDVISQRSIEAHNSLEISSKIYHGEDEQQFEGNIFDYLNDKFTIILDTVQEDIPEKDFSKSSQKIIRINSFGSADSEIKSTSQPSNNKSVREFIEIADKLFEEYYRIQVTAEGRNNLERLREIVDNNIQFITHIALKEKYEIVASKIEWNDLSLSNGFICETLKIAVFSEHEIFGRTRIQDNRRGKRRKGGLTLKELKQLNTGDLVVHVDKGIGRFDGLETILVGGKYHESARLIFADNDKLYVHLNYIHKIQKFTAEEGVVPKLSKLGSGEWQRKKEKTRKRLKDIARELISLYAKRKAMKGFAYPFDNSWQKEFEASFIYEDTPDQAKTISEVKTDMEAVTPMDRLVCGDVGYGKTEVAIRAAFKAVQANKQVAVLVPTTVLAQQHYLTFKDRFENFPVIVQVISRFKTAKEQKEIIEKLKGGKIDILIGTHRLLSKDIQFNDFGLLVVDEEHRFGVGAKEKLKNLKENIDTITLTATPIPRTLNYSLMGARDLSVIETPPRNRLPIETEILEWNNEFIQKAITHEVNRRGQVFFVTDRVDDIELIKFDLQKLLPEMKFGIVHGQMPASEIEKAMENFIEKKFDVLIATKIIESGLDIPNANTIIINRAQNFGLAELYQLRGRVGRSNIQAFCYLIIPPARNLSNQAIRRLQAIEEFSDLGSGFQLAMRDLEIRGAGNLLGPEQSGFINEIGFDLYNQILDDAVRELKLTEFSSVFEEQELDTSFLNNDDIQIDTDKDALFPHNYIQSDKERFYYYKRLYNLESFDELASIIDELKDKFGDLPKEAEELIFVVRIRIAALKTGFVKVSIARKSMSLEFPERTNKTYYDLIFPEIIDIITQLTNVQMKQTAKKLISNFEFEKRENAIDILWRIKKTIISLTNV